MKQQALNISGVILRTIICGWLTWYFGKTGLHMLMAYQPEFDHEGVSHVGPMAITFLIDFAAFFAVLALGGSYWRGVLWAIRITILATVYFAWDLRWLLHRDQWIGTAFALVCLAAWHYMAHRHALGWIIDSHGERQKVEHWVRGEPIYTPTTRQQRLKEEAEERNSRRWIMLGCVVVGFPLTWFGFHLPPSFPKWLEWVFLIVGAPFDAALLLPLSLEGLYLIGYQDMVGHRVKCPPPQRPGAAEVSEQMAYGAASVADAKEASNLLQGGH